MAENSKFSKKQIDDYEERLKIYRDWKNTVDTAEMKGVEKGIQQGLEQGLQRGCNKGAQKASFLPEEISVDDERKSGTDDQICQLTGWNREELPDLSESNG